ncbi:MAG: hypothetical protein LBJ32_02565 [Oscillospiraceae bacterium]|nr:hypothetical protein [Oscillospiraceae bacterium]
MSIERDEMWSYYQDKSNQIWLWWAINHTDGTSVAFWFGRRVESDHFALQKLLELLNNVNFVCLLRRLCFSAYVKRS